MYDLSKFKSYYSPVISISGGLKKIPGVHYVGGNETPKYSRQLIWRSAVEMSRNVAQLALQVHF